MNTTHAATSSHSADARRFRTCALCSRQPYLQRHLPKHDLRLMIPHNCHQMLICSSLLRPLGSRLIYQSAHTQSRIHLTTYLFLKSKHRHSQLAILCTHVNAQKPRALSKRRVMYTNAWYTYNRTPRSRFSASSTAVLAGSCARNRLYLTE